VCDNVLERKGSNEPYSSGEMGRASMEYVRDGRRIALIIFCMVLKLCHCGAGPRG
jgi:hypothetical protein